MVGSLEWVVEGGVVAGAVAGEDASGDSCRQSQSVAVSCEWLHGWIGWIGSVRDKYMLLASCLQDLRACKVPDTEAEHANSRRGQVIT